MLLTFCDLQLWFDKPATIALMAPAAAICSPCCKTTCARFKKIDMHDLVFRCPSPSHPLHLVYHTHVYAHAVAGARMCPVCCCFGPQNSIWLTFRAFCVASMLFHKSRVPLQVIMPNVTETHAPNLTQNSAFATRDDAKVHRNPLCHANWSGCRNKAKAK